MNKLRLKFSQKDVDKMLADHQKIASEVHCHLDLPRPWIAVRQMRNKKWVAELEYDPMTRYGRHAGSKGEFYYALDQFYTGSMPELRIDVLSVLREMDRVDLH